MIKLTKAQYIFTLNMLQNLSILFESGLNHFFVGEATSLNLWSYLHGARLTGIIEADRLIKILKK